MSGISMIIAPERIEAGIRYRRTKRDDFIIKIMSNVVASLSGSSDFINLKNESEEFTASAESYVGGFIRTGKAQGLIDYTNDLATRTTYPFLDLTYLNTVQTNYEYIVSELQGWTE